MIENFLNLKSSMQNFQKILIFCSIDTNRGQDLTQKIIGGHSISKQI